LDLYDLSFLKAFFVFAVDRCGLFVGQGKTKRIERVTPAANGSSLFWRFLRTGGVLLLLEIAVGVVAVILGALVIVEWLREILRLGFCKCSKEYLEAVIRRVASE
jgi:hypothetical protein